MVKGWIERSKVEGRIFFGVSMAPMYYKTEVRQIKNNFCFVFWDTLNGCYHCIPGEILSPFYVRQISESQKLTILKALLVNRFLREKKEWSKPKPNIILH